MAEKSVKKGSQLYIVGKIKTRSYVDKEGNNKYITEILADTMLVLEKKQGQNNIPDSNRNVTTDKVGPSEVNEPGAPYQPDAGHGAPFNDIPGAGQSEDDLPF